MVIMVIVILDLLVMRMSEGIPVMMTPPRDDRPQVRADTPKDMSVRDTTITSIHQVHVTRFLWPPGTG